MKVSILATCRNMALLPASVMVFDTLRTGFPNADVEVTLSSLSNRSGNEEIRKKAKAVGATIVEKEFTSFEHPQWIGETMIRATDPTIILDTDVVFWDSCEEFTFSGLLAGYLCPRFKDEFTACITMPRLHTSFLWIADPFALQLKIAALYKSGTFLNPLHLFKPFVYFHEGVRYFQDCTGALYQAIGGEAFEPQHLACYDHLHYGTLLDVVAPRLPHGQHAATRHFLAYKDQATIKNSWPMYEQYYKERAA